MVSGELFEVATITNRSSFELPLVAVIPKVRVDPASIVASEEVYVDPPLKLIVGGVLSLVQEVINAKLARIKAAITRWVFFMIIVFSEEID